MNELSALSPSILAALGGLALVQVGLQIAAVVSLVRTPASQLTLGGRKWAWALIILLGEIIGPIVYFAAGRQPAPATDQIATVPVAERASVATDTLYGTAPVTPVAEEAAAVEDGRDTADVGADGTGMGELP